MFQNGPFLQEERDLIDAIAKRISDYVERLKSEEAKLDSEWRYHRLYDSMMDGVALADLEGNFLETNQAYLDMLGYSADEMLGLTYMDITPKECHAAEQRILETQSLMKGHSELYEKEVVRKDGTVIPVELRVLLTLDHEDNPAGLWAIVRNISERNQAKIELLQSEERMRTMLESLPTGIILIDKETHVIKEVNSAALEMIGLPEDQIVGEVCHRFICPADVGQCPITNMGKTMDASERILLTSDSQRMPILKTVRSIRLSDKEHILESFIDITDRKKAQDALRRTNIELSEFVHAMAHDLKGQFHKVLAYLHLIENEYDQESLQKATRIIHRMNDLLNASVLLADSGLVIDKTEDIELEGIVGETARTFIPDDIQFDMHSLPIVKGDRQKIGQIFSNLFRNAIEHGKPTTITIRAKKKKAGTAVFISNDGKPVPKKLIDKIFERGVTSKKGGTGLGLAIVKKIVEAHGWQISLVVKPQTSFKIFIPDG